jgi:phenylalanine-4-hydroxylase
MRTLYKIDTFQETYFVIRDFRELFEATEPDFTPYYEALASHEILSPRAVLPTDRVANASGGAAAPR